MASSKSTKQTDTTPVVDQSEKIVEEMDVAKINIYHVHILTHVLVRNPVHRTIRTLRTVRYTAILEELLEDIQNTSGSIIEER